MPVYLLSCGVTSFQEKGRNRWMVTGIKEIHKTFKARADVCRVHFPKPFFSLMI